MYDGDEDMLDAGCVGGAYKSRLAEDRSSHAHLHGNPAGAKNASFPVWAEANTKDIVHPHEGSSVTTILSQSEDRTVRIVTNLIVVGSSYLIVVTVLPLVEADGLRPRD